MINGPSYQLATRPCDKSSYDQESYDQSHTEPMVLDYDGDDD